MALPFPRTRKSHVHGASTPEALSTYGPIGHGPTKNRVVKPERACGGFVCLQSLRTDLGCQIAPPQARADFTPIRKRMSPWQNRSSATQFGSGPHGEPAHTQMGFCLIFLEINGAWGPGSVRGPANGGPVSDSIFRQARRPPSWALGRRFGLGQPRAPTVVAAAAVAVGGGLELRQRRAGAAASGRASERSTRASTCALPFTARDAK